MFFKRKDPQRNVHVGELKALKDQEFEHKIGAVLSYSNSIITKLEHSMDDFRELCENFALENPTVDNELIGNVSSATLASQKDAYVKAVLSIVNSTNAYKSTYATQYDLAYEKKSNFERALHEILQANSRFSIVILGYSGSMTKFKKQFSAMEKLSKELSMRMNSISSEVDERRAITAEIDKLLILLEELDAAKRNMGELEEIASGKYKKEDRSDEIKRIETIISNKHNELRDLNLEIDQKAEMIKSLIAPLERAARKYDHGSGEKSTLSHFITDPIKNIMNEMDYSEFVGKLKKLRASLTGSSLMLKNSDNILDEISTVLDANIYEDIAFINSERKKADELKDEIGEYDYELQNMLKNYKTLKDSKDMLASANERISNVTADILSSKSTIESLFLKYYDTHINIDLVL